MPSNNSSSINNIDESFWIGSRGQFRLVFLGAAEVGKTSIVQQFLYEQFPNDYIPTVEELYRGEFDIGDHGLVLDILDTSGSYQFPAMRKLAVTTGDAFALVYSIDNKESFEEVCRLKDMLEENGKGNVPIVVVGNKCDRVKERVIRRELAEIITTMDWENRFVESSAKENVGIMQIFKEILNQAKYPYEFEPAFQRRRTSLPLNSFPKNPCTSLHKNKQKLKRNSCAVS